MFAATFFGAVNLYKADVAETPGGRRVVAGPVVAESVLEGNGLHLMIHPDEVVLVPSEPDGKAEPLVWRSYRD